MIMVYVSLSNFFGSPSKLYLTNSEPSFLIGISLILYTFFSVLAGPYKSFLAGFFAELLYQLTSFKAIYIEWCLFIGIFGLACGFFNYKPLKILKFKSIFLLIGFFFIASLVGVFILFFFQVFLYKSMAFSAIELGGLIINFILDGFFVSTLISIPLLILYDYILSNKERVIYQEILTHHLPTQSDHAFYLQFGRTYIFFCSRCSGVIIGGLISIFTTTYLADGFNIKITSEIAIFLCIILPIPGMLDWGTQRLLYRKSNTKIRLLTGFILGIALHMMSFTSKYALFMLFLLILYFGALGILMYVGHKKEMKELEEEVNRIPKEESIEE